MRKLFNSMALVAIVIASAAFSSCEKDDDVNAPDSLTGTSWLYETGETVTNEDGVEIGVAIELDFVLATKVDINILVGGVKDNAFAVSGFSVGRFDYTYSKPNVTITAAGESSTGKIDGNKLTIREEDSVFVFVKEDF
jgi:hypothetical protein